MDPIGLVCNTPMNPPRSVQSIKLVHYIGSICPNATSLSFEHARLHCCPTHQHAKWIPPCFGRRKMVFRWPMHGHAIHFVHCSGIITQKPRRLNQQDRGPQFFQPRPSQVSVTWVRRQPGGPLPQRFNHFMLPHAADNTSSEPNELTAQSLAVVHI